MKKKRKKKSKKGISNLTNTILSILKKERNKSFNYKQIAAILGVNDASSRNQIIKTLAKLASRQEIEQVDRGKFKAIVNTEYHRGIVDLSGRGSAYIICDDFDASGGPLIQCLKELIDILKCLEQDGRL